MSTHRGLAPKNITTMLPTPHCSCQAKAHVCGMVLGHPLCIQETKGNKECRRGEGDAQTQNSGISHFEAYKQHLTGDY